MKILRLVAFCCALAVLYSIRENSHKLPLSDTSIEYTLSGGHIPDEDFLAAEAGNSMSAGCDSTVRQLDSYPIELYKKGKAIKITKLDGTIANQFNDRSPTLLQKHHDTVFITTVKVRYIHDTIYLADPVPNQPTYIK